MKAFRRHLLGCRDRGRAANRDAARKRRQDHSCHRAVILGTLSLDRAVEESEKNGGPAATTENLKRRPTEAEAAFKRTTTKVAEAPPKQTAVRA